MLDIVGVTLPGRAERYTEAPLSTLDSVVDRLVDELTSCDRDFALFGHSLGGLLAFELSRRLRDGGLPQPRVLIVAGCPAPDAPPMSPVHDLPTPDLIRWLRDLGGIDDEIAGARELLDVLLPALRADLAVYDTYRYQEGPPLPVPIRVLAGDADADCTVGRIAGWRKQSTVSCQIDILHGDHFFVHDDAERIIRLIEPDVLDSTGAAV
jgi:surfactin synthase thioesterase subunit